MIFICDPNNLTDSVLDEEEMDEIVRLTEDSEGCLHADENYRGQNLKGEDAKSLVKG